jgi:HPt (histidine-containing phosphotransfer) domain-containing protein
MHALSNSDAAARADLDFWRDLSEGSDESGRELLTLYLADTGAQILLMISGLAAGLTEDVGRAAHTCAGSSGTCGVDDLARLFRQLEYEARDGRDEAMATTLPLIVETFDGVQVRLLKAIAVPTSDPIQERK